MKPFDDGCAANDEFQSLVGGAQQGELIWDLLRQRVRIPDPIPGYLARANLPELLRQALMKGQVLHLEAPSGYGKTQAVRAALADDDSGTSQRLVRWISLTTQDNDASRLLALLTIALRPDGCLDGGASRRQVGGLADELSLLLSGVSRNLADQSLVLVLDNVDQVVSTSAVALLEHLVRELPNAVSLALLSRKTLPFETHALELEGRFTRVTSDTLELSRAETRAFFESAVKQRQVTSVAVEHLYTQTEGWLTPLALYRRELSLITEHRLPIQDTLSVERFLRDSVLGRLTPGQQRSLCVMAEMDAISDDLFQALTNDHCDSAFRPSAVVAAGLPMRAIPGRGRWYRLNPLLRDWLLADALPGRKERALAASQWFDQRGQFPEALRYALLSNEVDEAIRIASESSEGLLISQDTASLLRLHRSLPPGLLQRSPRLRIVYGWVHAVGGQFREARKLMEQLTDEEQQTLHGRLAALRAFILRGEGVIKEALAEADHALADQGLSIHAQLVTQLVRASAFCALGRFSEAREANRHATRLAREAGDSGSELLAVYTHSCIELGKGSLRHAEQLLRTGLDTAMNEVNRPNRVGESRLQLNLALVLWHQGRETETDRLLVTCARYAEQSRDLGLLLVMAMRVLICRARNQLDDAFSWIGRAERTMQAWQVDESFYVPVLEALKASCWLACDQTDSARQAMKRLKPYRERRYVPELFPMMPGLLDCLQVRLDIASGNYREASRLLRQIQGQGMDAVLPFGVAIHVQLLTAVLAYHTGDQGRGKELLAKVIGQAAEEHFMSPFAELRNELEEPIARVLPGLSSALANHPFVHSLRVFYGLENAATPVAELAEPISDREQGVLELIAQGLSNQDIADRLHISLHTVKTHARRINAKLEVKSRTQAIVRARELGLL